MGKLWLPDSRLESTELFDFGKKPACPTKIDYTHHFAGKWLQRFYMLKSFSDRDYVTGKRAAPYDINTGEMVQHVDGIEFQGDGSSSASGQILIVDNIGDMPEGTVVVSFTPNLMTEEQFVFSHSDFAANRRLYLGVSATGALYLRLGSGSVMATSISLDEGAKNTIAIAWSGTTASVAKEGKVYADTYTFADYPGSSSNYTSIGAYNASGNAAGSSQFGFSGVVHDLLVSSRRFSSNEIQRITLNPYQLLIPA